MSTIAAKSVHTRAARRVKNPASSVAATESRAATAQPDSGTRYRQNAMREAAEIRINKRAAPRGPLGYIENLVTHAWYWPTYPQTSLSSVTRWLPTWGMSGLRNLRPMRASLEGHRDDGPPGGDEDRTEHSLISGLQWPPGAAETIVASTPRWEREAVMTNDEVPHNEILRPSSMVSYSVTTMATSVCHSWEGVD